MTTQEQPVRLSRPNGQTTSYDWTYDGLFSHYRFLVVICRVTSDSCEVLFQLVARIVTAKLTEKEERNTATAIAVVAVTDRTTVMMVTDPRAPKAPKVAEAIPAEEVITRTTTTTAHPVVRKVCYSFC